MVISHANLPEISSSTTLLNSENSYITTSTLFRGQPDGRRPVIFRITSYRLTHFGPPSNSNFPASCDCPPSLGNVHSLGNADFPRVTSLLWQFHCSRKHPQARPSVDKYSK